MYRIVMSPILFELSMSNYSCYLVPLYSPRGYTCSIALTTERSRALGYATARDRLCDSALASGGLHHPLAIVCVTQRSLGLHQSSLAVTD